VETLQAGPSDQLLVEIAAGIQNLQRPKHPEAVTHPNFQYKNIKIA
jgi:hypothetical protein